MPPTPEDAMERLHTSIVKDIEQVVAAAVKKALGEKRTTGTKTPASKDRTHHPSSPSRGKPPQTPAFGLLPPPEPGGQGKG